MIKKKFMKRRQNKMEQEIEIIEIDHGWSMVKTSSQVFVTGVKEITTEPGMFDDVLELDGKYYKIGGVRLEVRDVKIENDNFYILTLAGVARELRKRGKKEASVFIAAGLPLTRFGVEKSGFLEYLTKRKEVNFYYEKELYKIRIVNAAVFPQCYAAIADRIQNFGNKVVIIDIGSWTIDIMPVIDRKPDNSRCTTTQQGLITCMRSVNDQCVRQLGAGVDESEIQYIMRHGTSDIDEEYLEIIKKEIKDYTDRVFNSLREYGYNLKTTQLVFVGGGAIVMKNFSMFRQKNINYILDVKANAKGFEYLANIGLKRR